MSSVRFCMANTASDISCPRCGQGLDIDEWMTEYGDPIQGTCSVNCPLCQGSFLLHTDICVKYSVSRVRCEI